MFKTRFQAIVGALAIIFILNASLQSIFFGSDREIVYKHSTIVFLCLKDSTSCVYISELKLANTGVNILNDISVSFSEIPKNLETSFRVRNLNAGKPRDIEPDLDNTNFKDGHIIKISNLSPGTLVVVKISGDIPVESISLLTHLNISVLSEAAIINANPQGTEFARLLSMFF